jgi:hypothetical protein
VRPIRASARCNDHEWEDDMQTIDTYPAGCDRRTLARIVVTVCAALGWSGAGWAAPVSAAAPADVPEALRVDGPVVTTVHATGAQVYSCTTDASGTRGWTLKGPAATFKGPGGLRGRHFEGPTWQSSVDNSKVAGQKIADQPSPVPTAVPWLLLKATSHEGTGVFSTVTFIQRLHTTGGKPPAAPCGTASRELLVKYTADYVFYGTGATPHQATH